MKPQRKVGVPTRVWPRHLANKSQKR